MPDLTTGSVLYESCSSIKPNAMAIEIILPFRIQPSSHLSSATFAKSTGDSLGGLAKILVQHHLRLEQIQQFGPFAIVIP